MKLSKNLLKAVLPLLISVVLFILIGKFGIGKISDIRKSITLASRDKTTLTEKLSTLRSLSGEVETGSQITSVALPDKNPALVVISQLKSLAGRNLVSLNNIKSSTGVLMAGDIISSGISFEITGPKDGVLSMISEIGSIAPLTIIDNVKLVESAGSVQAEIALKTYSSPYPTKLPTTTSPVNALTGDDRKTLEYLSQLTLPQFSQIQPSVGGKSDPFVQ